MSKWEIIKSLKFKQFVALFVWFLKHPVFMFATIKATIYTLKIAQKEFPNLHGGHNKPNAFRHALWNVLIAKESSKYSSSVDKVIVWTKDITDWHEEFLPNAAMAKLMDLHNNAFGRNFYLANKTASISYFVNKLKDKMSDAVLVKDKIDFNKIPNQLVYLEK